MKISFHHITQKVSWPRLNLLGRKTDLSGSNSWYFKFRTTVNAGDVRSICLKHRRSEIARVKRTQILFVKVRSLSIEIAWSGHNFIPDKPKNCERWERCVIVRVPQSASTLFLYTTYRFKTLKERPRGHRKRKLDKLCLWSTLWPQLSSASEWYVIKSNCG